MKYTKSSLKKLIKEAIVEKQAAAMLREIEAQKEVVESLTTPQGAATPERKAQLEQYVQQQEELRAKAMQAIAQFSKTHDMKHLEDSRAFMAQATALSNKYKSLIKIEEGMKVTKSSLKTIIEEELQKLLE